MVGRGLMRSRLAASAFAALALLSCSNPLRLTLEAAVTDYVASEVRVLAGSVEVRDGMGIDKQSALVLEFPRGMKRGDVVIGGDLLAESTGALWSTRADTDDTLSLAPKTVWGPGSARSLSLAFVTATGTARSALALSLGVLDGVVYVRASDGCDAYPGTSDKPLRSVTKAVALAAGYYATATVRVAGGLYPVNYQSGTQVRLAKGISVLGGYDPSNWSNRDPTTFVSTIRDDSSSPSSTYICAVECEAGLGGDALLEGFAIRGGGNSSVATSFGVRCKDAGPTIRNNDIIGGSGELSVGLLVINGSATVSGNTIDGGTGVDSVGIYTKNCLTGLLISGNTITGGKGSHSRMGVQNYAETRGGSAPVLRGNLITASDGMADFAVGVWDENCDSLIEENSIRAGRSWKSGSGIEAGAGSRPVIRNNLIEGGEGYYHAAIDLVDLSVGIDLGGDGATVINNTICGGAAGSASASAASTGIYLQMAGNGATTVIENNIIFTLSGNTRYGLWELASGAHPASLANNIVFDCPTALYTFYAVGSPATFVTTAAGFAPYAWASSNLSGDPLFIIKSVSGSATGSDWHLGTASPAKGAAKIQSSFTVDREGTARGTSWSIGAYQ